MKARNSIIILVIIAILAGSIFVALNGLEFGGKRIPTLKESINLGLDLAGGVYVVLEADTDAKGEDLKKLMEQTRTIISERVDSLGVSEPNIAIEGDNRIRVELAGIENPQEAVDLIGKTAQLQFIDSDGEIILTGKNVVGSDVKFQERGTGQRDVVVSLEFDKDGRDKFAEVTGRLINEKDIEKRVIYIVLDGEIISYPSVEHVDKGGKAITDGQAVITGGFDIESATNLANLIRAGALPADMIERTTSVIGPTLGLEAFEKSIFAAGIGLLLIFIFMIGVYKILGIVASVSMLIYILLVLTTMSVLGVVLTLPGIAGLILSIGMAVDANVLIFERIREEVQVGKTLRTSIESGFKRALTSVIDSNFTTFIAGAVLYYYGVGPVKGFGVTLIIGIIASMITSVLITKYLLRLVVSFSDGSNTKIYGA